MSGEPAVVFRLVKATVGRCGMQGAEWAGPCPPEENSEEVTFRHTTGYTCAP